MTTHIHVHRRARDASPEMQAFMQRMAAARKAAAQEAEREADGLVQRYKDAVKRAKAVEKKSGRSVLPVSYSDVGHTATMARASFSLAGSRGNEEYDKWMQDGRTKLQEARTRLERLEQDVERAR